MTFDIPHDQLDAAAAIAATVRLKSCSVLDLSAIRAGSAAR